MDLLLQDNGDGGEFILEGGDLKPDGTLYNAVYLSLFNGDAFYNVFENYKTDDSFEKALFQTITVNNLKIVEKTGAKLLKWLLDEGLAKEVTLEATGDIQSKINVSITITEPDDTTAVFAIVWDNQKYILKTM